MNETLQMQRRPCKPDSSRTLSKEQLSERPIPRYLSLPVHFMIAMDATALYAYKHLNTFFIYPCLHDGYPSRLGVTLVHSIPTLPNEFDDWLRKSRKYYGRVLKRMECSSGSVNDLGCIGRPSSEPPVKDENFVWVYIVDLDNLIFSVDNGAHFKLDCIPRGSDGEDWIRYLSQDGTGRRCLRPSAPRSLVADPLPSVDLDSVVEDTAKYHSLHTTFIEPAEWTDGLCSAELAVRSIATTVLRAVIGHFYGTLCNACQYAPTDSKFRYPAEYLLRASAPNFLQLHFDGEAAAEVSAPEPDKGPDTGLPECGGVFYWFRGCLILLSTRLDSEMHLRADVVRVVARVREKGLKKCTALIWSLRHVVVVSISPDQVSHSRAQPVLVAYGNDDSAFCTSVHLLAHYLHPTGKVFLAGGGCDAVSSGSSLTKNKHGLRALDSESKEANAFAVSGPRLPADVILEIMKFVDVDTYCTVFGRLTRETRMAYLRTTRIGSYIIYGSRTAPPANKAELISSFISLFYDTEADTNSNDLPLLGHTENGQPFNLNLLYQGHSFLGNYTSSTLCANSESERWKRVSIRWPRDLNTRGGKLIGDDAWLQIDQCGLYLWVIA